MKIETFSFGSITIDNIEFGNDVILLPPRVIAHWRRLEGHRLQVDDLSEVIAFHPDILVVGSGVSNMMRMSENTIKDMESFSIQVEVFATPEAVERFNGLVEEGEKVAAAMHLTC